MTSTEKPYYKAILLVLASDNTPLYQEFRKVYQAYLDSNPNIRVFLVYGNQYSFEPQSYDLVYNDIEENYNPGMITKTVRAIEYIDANYDYDFLIRTNLSTFWHLDGLFSRLKNTPTQKCFTGSLISCRYKDQSSPQYIAGVNLILSRDLVKHLIDDQDEMCQWKLPEDWAMSQVLINRGFTPVHAVPSPIHFMEKFVNTDQQPIYHEISIAQKHHRDHYRIKNTKVPGQRQLIDLTVANILLKEYYGKTLF